MLPTERSGSPTPAGSYSKEPSRRKPKRFGDDGFAYAGLAQYNSFNNIVWRNDPDHIELNEDAFRSTLVTTLTGSLLMPTDKPAVYRTAAIEPAKRAAA